jgi:hypothetical protein
MGSGNKTIRIVIVIPLNKERSVSNSDNPVDNQTTGYGMSKSGDIAGARPGGQTWGNSDDIAVFYNRRHTETLRFKPERCALSKNIPQELHHIVSGKIKLMMLHAKAHVHFPERISAGIFRLISSSTRAATIIAQSGRKPFSASGRGSLPESRARISRGAFILPSVLNI